MEPIIEPVDLRIRDARDDDDAAANHLDDSPADEMQLRSWSQCSEREQEAALAMLMLPNLRSAKTEPRCPETPPDEQSEVDEEVLATAQILLSMHQHLQLSEHPPLESPTSIRSQSPSSAHSVYSQFSDDTLDEADGLVDGIFVDPYGAIFDRFDSSAVHPTSPSGLEAVAGDPELSGLQTPPSETGSRRSVGMAIGGDKLKCS